MSDKNSPLILGTEPIGKLLTQYAIPAIIAMTASSLYNMADSIFIGHGVGAMGIAGLALTFPLMNLAAAFGSLVGATSFARTRFVRQALCGRLPSATGGQSSSLTPRSSAIPVVF